MLTLASIRRITSPGFWKTDIKAFNENTACWLMAQSITLSVSSFLFRCSFPENVPLSPHWLSYLVCYWPVFEVHCARYTLALKWTHTHTFPFLPSPKGLVWFMPFVRVWVGLKEIMVWLPWECGAFLNWCLFSHVHHIRPCSLEITHQSLGKSPLLQCQLGVQTTEVLVGAAFQKRKKQTLRRIEKREKESTKLEPAGFVIRSTRHYSYIPQRPPLKHVTPNTFTVSV